MNPYLAQPQSAKRVWEHVKKRLFTHPIDKASRKDGTRLAQNSLNIPAKKQHDPQGTVLFSAQSLNAAQGRGDFRPKTLNGPETGKKPTETEDSLTEIPCPGNSIFVEFPRKCSMSKIQFPSDFYRKPGLLITGAYSSVIPLKTSEIGKKTAETAWEI